MRGRGNDDRCVMRKMLVVAIDNGVADFNSPSGLGQRDDSATEASAGDSCAIYARHRSRRVDKRIDLGG